jgi:ABC-type cobalamin transport system ATPase subunit
MGGVAHAETESWPICCSMISPWTRSYGAAPFIAWQRTTILPRAAVVEPDLLLLDEPTNHLDIGRIGLLERFLATLPRDCAVIAESHDRAFLDVDTPASQVLALFLAISLCSPQLFV